MITKFARLEFELFTKPSKRVSAFLQQMLSISDLDKLAFFISSKYLAGLMRGKSLPKRILSCPASSIASDSSQDRREMER